MSGHGHVGDVAPGGFWEERYAGEERVWSGKVNRTTADVAIGLEPGRSLDLGCGEGGDVLWFAHAGWQAMGVDISPTAVRRANEEAARVGRADRARCVAADLATWTTDDRFDLVTASFFQSPVALDRTTILRRLSRQIDAGGHLLVVSHADYPSWVPPEDRQGHGQFLKPDEEAEALNLLGEGWTVEIAETRTREVTAPDGSPAVLDDSVVLLRRG
ncbi:class I SAM-dependent methyltransferase [Sanguibacter hominis ATCC BAA-789]|uniref:Class I SAM-dependent methyltransferase n=1 Tax=Sanguibacter hominis ATCC BAA-789 TaxID=1312740 RepID=A0A9X5IRM4_9MICO|nr:class I SAM-dependent methyltransferase [Sanguibacter hominis]NKX92166.1 class I SAM-dependent methyltransferase [Sanguibacter hominis ATCC BAA-789]